MNTSSLACRFPGRGPPRGHPQPRLPRPYSFHLCSLRRETMSAWTKDRGRRNNCDHPISAPPHQQLCFTILLRHSSSSLNFLLHLSALMKKCKKGSPSNNLHILFSYYLQSLRISQDKLWLSLKFNQFKKDAYIYSGIYSPGARSWSKEGHIVTCRIAQDLLEPEAAEAIRNLLPHQANGDLSSLCTWPDQIRHWYKYRWTSSLHFIDTPDNSCSFDYTRDCHDPKGLEDMCVAGAVQNFTAQLMHYREGSSDRRYNLTESLLFLSHFMGDIHQPMHVGFTSDKGGNTINLRWFRHKSNLHHVWDREIILTALTDYYGKDLDAFQEDLQKNFTAGIWSDDTSSWGDCDDLFSCPKKWASESISLACKWGYQGITQGETLSDEYFDSRMPIVMKRIAQGGVRLAMILNRVFGEHNQEIPPPT